MINVSDFYLSPDKAYITGVTDYPDPIGDNGSIVIGKKDNKNFKRVARVSVDTVHRTGVVNYFVPLKQQQCSRRLYTDSKENGKKYEDIDVTATYVTYNDTCYYKFTLEDEDNSISGYFINGIFYQSDKDDSTSNIVIHAAAPIDKGVVTLNGIEYTAYATSDENNKWVLKTNVDLDPITTINGSAFTINMYEKPIMTQNLSIESKRNEDIGVLSVMCGSYYYYITVNGVNYRVDRNEDGKWGTYYDGVYQMVSEIYNTDTDIPPTNTMDNHWIVLRDYNGNLIGEYVVNANLAASDSGDFLILITEDENKYNVNDFILAKTKENIEIKEYLTEEDGDLFLLVNGIHYNAIAHTYDTVNIAGEDYQITYTGVFNLETGCIDATCEVNGETIPLVVKDYSFAMRDDMSFVDVTVDDRTFSDFIQQSYSGTDEYMTNEYGNNVAYNSGYTVTSGYGITVNNTTYRVFEEIKRSIDGLLETSYYIMLAEPEQYRFVVRNIIGSSTLLCYPYDENYVQLRFTSSEELVPSGEAGPTYEDRATYWHSSLTEIAKRVNDYSSVFTFQLEDFLFGPYGMKPEDGLAVNLMRNEPTSTLDVNGINENMTFSFNSNYLKMQVPFNVDTDVRRIIDESSDEMFITLFGKTNINRIIDMEKIQYRLYDNLSDCNRVLSMTIYTDYDPEFVVNADGSCPNNVNRSFFRLSFYDSMNPQAQLLIGTLTVFLGPSSMDGNIGYGGAELIDNLGLNGYRIYDALIGKGTSSEGLTLYAFKENFNALVPIDAYMKIEFNNARDGRVIPLSKSSETLDIKDLAKSLYFKFKMAYDGEHGYMFVPDDNDLSINIVDNAPCLNITGYVPKIE